MDKKKLVNEWVITWMKAQINELTEQLNPLMLNKNGQHH